MGAASCLLRLVGPPSEVFVVRDERMIGAGFYATVWDLAEEKLLVHEPVADFDYRGPVPP
jgi:hypothetical protein